MLLNEKIGNYATTEYLFSSEGAYLGTISLMSVWTQISESIFEVTETRTVSPILSNNPLAYLNRNIEYKAEIEQWITHYKSQQFNGSSTRWGDKGLTIRGIYHDAGYRFEGFTIKYTDEFQLSVRYFYQVSELIGVICSISSPISISDSPTLSPPYSPIEIEEEWYGTSYAFDPLDGVLAGQSGFRREYRTENSWQDTLMSSLTGIKQTTELTIFDKYFKLKHIFNKVDGTQYEYGIGKHYKWMTEMQIHNSTDYKSRFSILDSERRCLIEFEQGWTDYPDYIGPTGIMYVILKPLSAS